MSSNSFRGRGLREQLSPVLLVRGPWRLQSDCWPRLQSSEGSPGAGGSGSRCTQVAVAGGVTSSCAPPGLLLKWQLPPRGRGRCERRCRWKWPVRVARFRRRHPSLSPRSVGRVDQPGTAWGAGSRWRTERWWRSVQRSEGTTQDGPAGRLGGGAEGRPCLQREQAPRTPGRGQGAPGFRDMRLCRGFAWALGHGPYW